jgi:DNA-binding IclR family transcriptional regulator
MYVAKQEGTAHTHVSISIGNRFPLNEVSWGQWVVAYADPQDQKEILADGLPRVSDTNITDPDEYLAHAMSCRELGILTTSGDYMPGIWAASAPVVTHDQKLVGILAIIGVADVLADDERTRAAEVMKEVGRRTVISQPAG